MSKRKLNIILGILALILGFLLYVLFRENVYIAKCFDNFEIVVQIRRCLLPYTSGFLKYYLPDFLWGFSLCCGLQAIYNPGIKGTIVCGCAAFFCGGIWEWLQYRTVVNGTGDVLDIMFYFLACISNIIVNLRREKNEEN